MEEVKRNKLVLNWTHGNRVTFWDFGSYFESVAFSKGQKVYIIEFYNETTEYNIELSEYMKTPERKAKFDAYLKRHGIDPNKWAGVFIVDVSKIREQIQKEREKKAMFFVARLASNCDDEAIKNLIEHDYITINKGRDGAFYAWYVDEFVNEAVSVNGLIRLSKDEISKLLE